MTTYILKGGGSITAASPADFVTQLRRMSFNPGRSIVEYMRYTAAACLLQSGAIIRTDNTELFLEDMLASGFVDISQDEDK